MPARPAHSGAAARSALLDITPPVSALRSLLSPNDAVYNLPAETKFSDAISFFHEKGREYIKD